jgi:carbonic anhydrase
MPGKHVCGQPYRGFESLPFRHFIPLVMKKLIQGILDFRQKVLPGYRKTFAKLALGQKPDALFVACSDSRVVPNLFASSDPGDLFVIRNVGNLIPPVGGSGSVGAAVEFAVNVLQVKDIIVCGHSECGAMEALLKTAPDPSLPRLKTWLDHGRVAVEKLQGGSTLDKTLKPHDQLSQLNVLEQMKHLESFPEIKERLKQGKLHIHGWWFDIRRADVYAFEAKAKRFLLIDEAEADRILKRMDIS